MTITTGSKTCKNLRWLIRSGLFLFTLNTALVSAGIRHDQGRKHPVQSDTGYSNTEEQELFGASATEITDEESDDHSGEYIPVFGPDHRINDPNNQPVTLSDYNAEEYIEAPSAEQVQEILSTMYDSKGELLEEMKSFVVGLKGQDRLLTLAEAYKAGLLSPTGAGAILFKVRDFSDGETKTLHLRFGLRRGEDIVIGRYPSSLLARPLGNEAFHPGDPSLGPFVKWLELLGHLTWVDPLGAGSPTSINPTSQFGYQYSLSSVAASIHYNHYSEAHQRNLFGGAYTNPRGTGASFGVGDGTSSHSFWYSIMHGWQGLGYTGLFNMEEQELGLSALGVGAFVGGWKSYVQFGASLNAVFANGNQVGLGGVITLSKDRVTSYQHPYRGEYDSLIDQFILDRSFHEYGRSPCRVGPL